MKCLVLNIVYNLDDLGQMFSILNDKSYCASCMFAASSTILETRFGLCDQATHHQAHDVHPDSRLIHLGRTHPQCPVLSLGKNLFCQL